ncbi:hypothetical protein [Mycobacterium intracellulare]|jgi:hypothetical protein|uniref:hypothetical protein n=1 Tax=Mycobacterium intracellulare TaxID=1767 RepID=UPI000BAC243A|nr:hypothetical protein [Mycobacterium intracellulare]ASX03547.1 hypothetical protein CKJ58_26365 [Mycobacterium intracellulare subsp. chimaera]PBA61330.1 hypothetical protein CKJ56_13335 [Mycobacterium intracellulare subsp. chimaera]
MSSEPTAREALDAARDEITSARQAALSGNDSLRSEYAMAAIDSAATALLDPEATPPEVVAARFFLHEGLALDGRAGACGADSIHTEDEASALDADAQAWLQNYLLTQREQPAAALYDNSIGL